MSEPPPFCATVTCALHLVLGDPRMQGQGEWARLPNGIVVGRTVVDGQRFCDVCARDLIRGLRPAGIPLAPGELEEVDSVGGNR